MFGVGARPDFTIFVHPDADEHQGAQFLALRRALKLIKTQSKFAHEAIDLSAGPATADAGEECLGVTCLSPLEPEEIDAKVLPGLFPKDRFGRNSCTARQGNGGLQESPEGREVSYIKNCGGADEELGGDHVAGATYRAVNNSFLFGYAAGDEVVRGELETRSRCDDLGSACAGFTCEKSIAASTKRGYAEAQARGMRGGMPREVPCGMPRGGACGGMMWLVKYVKS
eukprot:Skav232371  [mRNA]  locus=scaffold1077:33661:37172:+ [translate_table: standard]